MICYYQFWGSPWDTLPSMLGISLGYITINSGDLPGIPYHQCWGSPWDTLPSMLGISLGYLTINAGDLPGIPYHQCWGSPWDTLPSMLGISLGYLTINAGDLPGVILSLKIKVLAHYTITLNAGDLPAWSDAIPLPSMLGISLECWGSPWSATFSHNYIQCMVVI